MSFIILGILALMWGIVWHLVVSETPSMDPNISDVEREYIEDSIGPTTINNVRNNFVNFSGVLVIHGISFLL